MIRKKIVFILPSFKTGGVERVTLNIINSLDFHKYEVHLLILEKGNNTLLSSVSSLASILEIGKPSLRKASFELYKALKQINPDVVFTSFNHISLFIGVLKMLYGFKFKTIVRLNSLPSNKLVSNKRDKIYDVFFSKVVKKSNVVISQSNEMTQEVAQYYNLDITKIETIRNPIDQNAIVRYSSEECDVLFDREYFNLVAIGSLSSVKGFDLLIEAIYNIKTKDVCDYRLYIIGENRETNEDYHAKLENLIRKLDLEKEVFLLGYQSNPYTFLKNADAFVLSSRKEGFPNVVLEALVLKKPCLVTDCVDLSDVVCGDRGLVVKKDSVKELEKGIIAIRYYKGSDSEFENYDFNTLFNHA
ncbi:glycosyltransferase [Myroides sp. M-43]|uniref:glycosyltransferase n=1 Tax=Myroides oncorhynchi TaxID=2893756 RepID=UPI001E44969A|nr:glycosyltransferase [Myroides oncorhynchi]MCC9043603.1 glycosyltransferase [Myroides oncorhynchi]